MENTAQRRPAVYCLTPALKIELSELLEHWRDLEADAGPDDEGTPLLSRPELIRRRGSFQAAMRSLDLEAVRRVVWAFDDELRPLRDKREGDRERWLDDSDHDDEYPDDDPHAPGAPAPLVVVAPRSSGPRVAVHPYKGTTQYQQAQKAARKVIAPASPRQHEELAALKAVFGERKPAYGIGSTGRTGNKPGRPPEANPTPARAIEHLEADTGRPVAELRAFRSKGKPNAQQKALRDTLAPVVAAILDSKRSTVDALAEALECSSSAVKRLRAK